MASSNLGHHFHSLTPSRKSFEQKSPQSSTHPVNTADKSRNLTGQVTMIPPNSLSASKGLIRTVHYPQEGGLTLLDRGNRYSVTAKRLKTCNGLINRGIIILNEYMHRIAGNF